MENNNKTVKLYSNGRGMLTLQKKKKKNRKKKEKLEMILIAFIKVEINLIKINAYVPVLMFANAPMPI